MSIRSGGLLSSAGESVVRCTKRSRIDIDADGNRTVVRPLGAVLGLAPSPASRDGAEPGQARDQEIAGRGKRHDNLLRPRAGPSRARRPEGDNTWERVDGVARR